MLSQSLIAAALAAAPAAAPDPLAALSARQLAGQRIVEGIGGRAPSAALLGRIRRGEVAGVILFTRNIGSRAQVRALIGRLEREPRPAGLRAPLLVMVDQEGGVVKRLPGAPSRSAAALGATGDRGLARRSGRATAANLRGYGINVDLAPVLDVGRPGSYQRATGRAFGPTAAVAGRMGGAFAAGLEAGGVASTLKHFPGLGAVRRNEDLLIQRVGLSKSRLRAVDEAPFAAGIRAGARMVMTSTALYAALDRRRPALLSRAVTTGELRRRLAFRGVVITDDLDVPAMRRYGSARALAPAAAGAGNDLLLFAAGDGSGPAGRDGLAAALRSGRLARAPALAAVRRILRLRAALGR